jgi:hypothetical protein
VWETATFGCVIRVSLHQAVQKEQGTAGEMANGKSRTTARQAAALCTNIVERMPIAGRLAEPDAIPASAARVSAFHITQMQHGS